MVPVVDPDSRCAVDSVPTAPAVAFGLRSSYPLCPMVVGKAPVEQSTVAVLYPSAESAYSIVAIGCLVGAVAGRPLWRCWVALHQNAYRLQALLVVVQSVPSCPVNVGFASLL